MALYPEEPLLRIQLPVLLAEKGQFDEALAELERVSSSDRDVDRLAASGYIHALAGHRSEAMRQIERLDRLDTPDKDLGIAMILVGLGEHETAVGRLVRLAEANRLFAGLSLNRYHWTAPLRADPRYKSILRSVGLEP